MQYLVEINTKINEANWLWHRWLTRISMNSLSKLIKKDLVVGLSKLNLKKKNWDACQLGKQTRVSFKSKNIVSISRPLELLHIDLFGPTKTTNLGGEWYGFIIIDNFSHFTWVLFLVHKDKTFLIFSKFYRKISNEKKIQFLIFIVIIESNLKIKTSKKFIMKKRLNIIFLHLGHPNKIR